MHEHALMEDVMRTIESIARTNGAGRVTCVVVRLGALSHFTPEHFRDHFADASRGTLAEAADVVATVDDDISAPGAAGVLIESVEIEESA